MAGHLVAVKVGVVCGTHQRVNLDGPAFGQHRLKSLDTKTVERWCAIEQYRMLFDNFFQNVPNFWFDSFYHPFSAFYVMGMAGIDQLFHDEGLEKFKGHLFRQAALMKFEFGTNNDNGSARVVNTLA